MVLLNSSTISVVISSGIVCSFTFLLFLSGYVLQQQTVRSLQEALQAPIEERVKPRLNALRRPNEDVNDTIITIAEGEGERLPRVDKITGLPEIQDNNVNPAKEDVQQIFIAAQREINTEDSIYTTQQSIKELWYTHIGATDFLLDTDDTTSIHTDLSTLNPTTKLELAYILSLPQPSDICSALYFTNVFKSYRSSLNSPKKDVPIIFLYPSTWEISSATDHVSAMQLLRDATYDHAQHNIQLHPVSISSVWTGVSISSQLLAELARNPWNYDRLLYLKTPGMLLDPSQLDYTLGPGTTPKTMKSDWTRLKAPSKRGTSNGALNPEILLWAQGRGLMEPKDGKIVERLTARADIDIEAEIERDARRRNWNTREIESARRRRVEELSQAAYISFDRDSISENTRDNVMIQRFDKERRNVCRGSGLIK